MELNEYSDRLKSSSNEIMYRLIELIENNQTELICMLLLETNVELNAFKKLASTRKKLPEKFSVTMEDVICAHDEIIQRLDSLPDKKKH